MFQELANCVKCIYDKILSLGGIINNTKHKQMSRFTQVLKDYQLPAKPALPNCPETDPTISLALQKWDHIKEFHAKIITRSSYLEADKHILSPYHEYYLALDMQYSLCLRVSKEKNVVDIGMLNYKTSHINSFFEQNNQYFLKYSYIGKQNHESEGVRKISKELFLYIKNRASNFGFAGDVLLFPNIDYESYSAYIAASFGNQISSHDVKYVACCTTTSSLCKIYSEKLKSKFYFNYISSFILNYKSFIS